MAGTASAIPMTKRRPVAPNPSSDPEARASVMSPAAAIRKPARARPASPPRRRPSGPAAKAANMPGRPARRIRNSTPGSCPDPVRCRLRPVYMATNDNRSVRCAPHRHSTSLRTRSRAMVRNCSPGPPATRVWWCSRVSQATARAQIVSRQVLPRNTHGQPNCWVMACAPICPVIPATRKAVDMAPMAVARCRGVTASLR